MSRQSSKPGIPKAQQPPMTGGALASIEKLLKLLSEHCKVCPQFAEEFEKLNLQ